MTLTVTNPSGRPLRARLRDAWPPSSWRPGTEPTASRHSLTVPAGERRRVTTRLRPTRRGDRPRCGPRHHPVLRPPGAPHPPRHPPGPLDGTRPPAVHQPQAPPLQAVPTPRRTHGRTSVLTRGEGTEFDSLREYVPGDDTRSIDWRATARHSTVAVRTWRPERDRRILLVLDTGRTSAGRGDAPRLDAAMDAALLLAALASRAGDRVDLLAYDRRARARVQGRTAGDVLPSLVNSMATLEPELVETDARGLTATALRSAPRRSLIVLFTTLDAAPIEEGLLPVLPQLTQRHSVLVASVADPHVARMAEARGDPDAVYEAAAAAQAQSERRHIADQLRRHGVTVVDATPDELPPALADAYLELKAAGRL
ncbi:hypothetical protein STENM327S_05253 [Streptomyces tendae]